jgi:hypothetical protein
LRARGSPLTPSDYNISCILGLSRVEAGLGAEDLIVTASRFTTVSTVSTQVHINVGAGEMEVASPRGLRLDDLSWHTVSVSRREAAFTLQIDVIHVVK